MVELIEIANEKAAGAFASGFKYTVLECQKTDEGVQIGFAKPEWCNYRAGKMNPCVMRIKDGIIYSGYAKHPFEWLGNCKELIERANWVAGATYDVKDEIKKLGLFEWNRDQKRWERQVPVPQEEIRIDPWGVANLSPADDTCPDLPTTVFIPRTRTITLQGACAAILDAVKSSNLGNWVLHSAESGVCQLKNSQTGWFINAKYRKVHENYEASVSRAFNFSAEVFEKTWAEHFPTETEYAGFVNVANCNGVKTLNRVKELLDLNASNRRQQKALLRKI